MTRKEMFMEWKIRTIFERLNEIEKRILKDESDLSAMLIFAEINDQLETVKSMTFENTIEPTMGMNSEEIIKEIKERRYKNERD